MEFTRLSSQQTEDPAVGSIQNAAEGRVVKSFGSVKVRAPFDIVVLVACRRDTAISRCEISVELNERSLPLSPFPDWQSSTASMGAWQM